MRTVRDRHHPSAPTGKRHLIHPGSGNTLHRLTSVQTHALLTLLPVASNLVARNELPTRETASLVRPDSVRKSASNRTPLTTIVALCAALLFAFPNSDAQIVNPDPDL